MSDVFGPVQVLTIKDAVTYSQLSRSTLYRLIQAGMLSSITVRGRRLIRRAELDTLLGLVETME